MYYAGTFLCSSPLGRLSDRVGRKPVVVSGMFLYALATLLFVTTTNAWWFLLFRLCEEESEQPRWDRRAAPSSPTSATTRPAGAPTACSRARSSAAWSPGRRSMILLNTLGGGGRHGFYTIFLVGSAMTLAMGTVLAVFLKEPAHVTAQRRGARGPAQLPLAGHPLGHRLSGGRRHEPFRHGRLGGAVEPVAAPPGRVDGLRGPSPGWRSRCPCCSRLPAACWPRRANRFRLMFVGYAFSACSWIVRLHRDLTVFLLFNVLEGVAVAISMPAKQAFLVQCSPRRWLGTVQGMEQSLDAARRLGGHAHGSAAVCSPGSAATRSAWAAFWRWAASRPPRPCWAASGRRSRRRARRSASQRLIASHRRPAGTFDDERSPAR